MASRFNDLGPSPIQTIFALALGTLGGLLAYCYSVHSLQQSYLDAIYRARPLVTIANADPLAPAGVDPLRSAADKPSPMPPDYAPRVVDLLMSSAGRADLAGPDSQRLRAIAAELTKGESACLHDLSIPGLDLLACMAASLAHAEGDGKRSIVDVHRPLLAAAAAGFAMPDSKASTADEYLAAASKIDSQARKLALERMTAFWGEGKVPKQLSWKFSTDAVPAAGQVVKTLNCFGLFRQCLSYTPSASTGSDATLGDAQQTIIDLQVASVGLLRSDSDVRFYQSALSAAIGYEQAGLWILFVWMLVLLILRFLSLISTVTAGAHLDGKYWRSLDANDSNGGRRSVGWEWLAERWYDSRWQFRWGAKALPAIGFVGTVRGILLALPQAESIVRAATPLEQSAAISNVAGSLGLAFSTTLLALIFGLVTTLLDDLQQRKENTLLANMELSS